MADDHVVVRQGLVRLLSERTDLEVVGEAGNGLDLLAEVKRCEPDLVITDISMPHLRGIEAVAELRSRYPRIRFVVLTMHNDPQLLEEAIAAGGDGYVLKEDAAQELFEAIDTVMSGTSYVSPRFLDQMKDGWWAMRRGGRSSQLSQSGSLTLREREIIKLIAEGKSSKEIAGLLFLSPRTVEHHRSNIMGKFNLKNAAEVIRFAFQRKLVFLALAGFASSFADDLMSLFLC